MENMRKVMVSKLVKVEAILWRSKSQNVRDKIREKSNEIINSCEDLYEDLSILDSLDEVYGRASDAFDSIKEYIIESENYGKCKI